MFFYFLLLSIIDQYLFFKVFFGHLDWIPYLVFITKNTNADRILFFNFLKIFDFSKFDLFPSNLQAFVIIFGLWSAGCKYMTKHHLKHSLSSKF